MERGSLEQEVSELELGLWPGTVVAWVASVLLATPCVGWAVALLATTTAQALSVMTVGPCLAAAIMLVVAACCVLLLGLAAFCWCGLGHYLLHRRDRVLVGKDELHVLTPRAEAGMRWEELTRVQYKDFGLVLVGKDRQLAVPYPRARPSLQDLIEDHAPSGTVFARSVCGLTQDILFTKP